jgi:hypothetical protein|tara:strand:+ start:181 stop:597 length:417 start_codon:yes stop_codon:yes gene_type:complete
METYADRLKREGRKQMTNYDMDALRRKEQEKVERNLSNADYDGMLGQTDGMDEPVSNMPPEDWEKRRAFAQDLIDSEKEKTVDIEIEISDDDFMHLAKAAHERDITLNQLCVDVLKSSFDDLDYRFEHQSKPTVLKEY